MVRQPPDHSNFLYWLFVTIVLMLLGTFIFTRMTFAETTAPLIIPVPTTRSVAPTTVIPPTGRPYYSYPSQTPNGTTTVITPSSQPIYSHPSASSYGPTTVITPGEMPTYVWPGVGE